MLNILNKSPQAREMGRQKNGFIGGRIGEILRGRLNKIAADYGVNDTRMLDDALSALANYVEASGRYRRPMAMVYDADAAAEWARVAEEHAPYFTAAEQEVLAQRETKQLEAAMKKLSQELKRRGKKAAGGGGL